MTKTLDFLFFIFYFLFFYFFIFLGVGGILSSLSNEARIRVDPKLRWLLRLECLTKVEHTLRSFKNVCFL
jgi:hypothetical protein